MNDETPMADADVHSAGFCFHKPAICTSGHRQRIRSVHFTGVCSQVPASQQPVQGHRRNGRLEWGAESAGVEAGSGQSRLGPGLEGWKWSEPSEVGIGKSRSRQGPGLEVAGAGKGQGLKDPGGVDGRTERSHGHDHRAAAAGDGRTERPPMAAVMVRQPPPTPVRAPSRTPTRAAAAADSLCAPLVAALLLRRKIRHPLQN